MKIDFHKKLIFSNLQIIRVFYNNPQNTILENNQVIQKVLLRSTKKIK